MALNLWPAPVIHGLSVHCTVNTRTVQYSTLRIIELIFERLLSKECRGANREYSTVNSTTGHSIPVRKLILYE